MSEIQITSDNQNNSFWNEIYYSLKGMGFVEEDPKNVQPSTPGTMKVKWNWDAIFIISFVLLFLLLALHKYISHDQA